MQSCGIVKWLDGWKKYILKCDTQRERISVRFGDIFELSGLEIIIILHIIKDLAR